MMPFGQRRAEAGAASARSANPNNLQEPRPLPAPGKPPTGVLLDRAARPRVAGRWGREAHDEIVLACTRPGSAPGCIFAGCVPGRSGPARCWVMVEGLRPGRVSREAIAIRELERAVSPAADRPPADEALERARQPRWPSHEPTLTYLYLARALRDCGDGFVAVLLPSYLLALGYSALQVGVIATAALFGSASLTLGVGIIGHRFDHRLLLLAAANLMIATGVAFAWVGDFALLVAVAFAGTVNPSAGSVSIFVPLEHAVLSGRVADRERTDTFARYSFIGAIAAACGGLLAAAPDVLSTLGLSKLTAIKAMFIFYALLGMAGAFAYWRIPPRPSLVAAARPAALGPSRSIVYKLAALFSLDAFAGGFLVQSLVALWLFERFDLSLAAAGLFFFWSGILAALSFFVAAWLSRHIGLVNTMVFTHVPSSICLILAAFAPTLTSALALLLLRAALSQMDVPTRSSYVMAVVTEAERAAAASFTSVPRSLAAALSPALAGALFSASFRALPFVICGVLKIVYDVLLLVQFRHLKPREEHDVHAPGLSTGGTVSTN
jgi:MFS family permease